jgi:hypothetical protein
MNLIGFFFFLVISKCYFHIDDTDSNFTNWNGGTIQYKLYVDGSAVYTSLPFATTNFTTSEISEANYFGMISDTPDISIDPNQMGNHHRKFDGFKWLFDGFKWLGSGYSNDHYT